jgi:hypothetical protein
MSANIRRSSKVSDSFYELCNSVDVDEIDPAMGASRGY